MITEDGRLKLRWYRPDDLGRLTALFEECYPREKWRTKDFGRFVDNRLRSNVVKVLTDEYDMLYGALLYTLEDDVCRARRVAVWERHRRRGLGAYMVRQLTSPRSPIHAQVVTARVHEMNTPAQLFLRRVDFTFDPDKPRPRAKDGREYWLFECLRPARQRLLTPA